MYLLKFLFHVGLFHSWQRLLDETGAKVTLVGLQCVGISSLSVQKGMAYGSEDTRSIEVNLCSIELCWAYVWHDF